MATPTSIRIHRARKRAKKTLAEVAAGVGVSASTGHRWECGLAEPGPRYRRALAEFLGVDVRKLVQL